MARVYEVTYRIDGHDKIVKACGNTRDSAARHGLWKLPEAQRRKALVISSRFLGQNGTPGILDNDGDEGDD